jgi:hypothetical protein
MGGIGLGLAVIILVVAIGIAVAMYLTGGALWLGKTNPDEDRVEGPRDTGDERRPEHTRPTSRYHENTEFVGTPQRERDAD